MRPIRGQLGRGWKCTAATNWITAGDRWRPERNCGQRSMTRDVLFWEMNSGMILIAMDHGWMTELDDRRRMTGDGSQEIDHGGWITIIPLPFHDDLEVIRSYTILEITHFDFEVQCCNQAQRCRYMMDWWRSGSSKYDTNHYSEHYSEISNNAATCPSANAKYDPKSDHESHRNNTATAHHQALRD